MYVLIIKALNYQLTSLQTGLRLSTAHSSRDPMAPLTNLGFMTFPIHSKPSLRNTVITIIMQSIIVKLT